MRILLASGSPSRRKLLLQAGLPHETFTPDIAEDAFLKQTRLPPRDICLTLARMKAEKAKTSAKNAGGAVLIACDQLAFLKNKPFGKARTKARAVQNLTELQGKTHQLIHGLYMSFRDKSFSHVSVNKMSMRPLSRRQIEDYTERDRPLFSAGSYLAESAGIGLFEKIETEDFYSIIGLPLTTIFNQLILWGFKWPVVSQAP